MEGASRLRKSQRRAHMDLPREPKYLHLRRPQKKRRKTVPLSTNFNLFKDQDADARQIQMLNKRIGKLGPYDRAIVLLWLENMSYEEIGAIVGITAKNVSVRLYRIKEQLKQMNND